MRLVWLACLLLVACAPPESAIGFQAGGTGYKSAPARLEAASGGLVLRGGAPAAVVLETEAVAGVEAAVGKTLAVRSGSLGLPDDRTLPIARGTLTVQSVQGGLARGNFEVWSGETEVRGSFDASL